MKPALESLDPHPDPDAPPRPDAVDPLYPDLEAEFTVSVSAFSYLISGCCVGVPPSHLE
ncbi:hypothetical protein HDU80_011755 [Chytriomyces hyalinus]|nr:hypothetical protein HDU80_011755 [Chytriomyces hyalinus]